jgi:hypothetical protein
VCLSQRLRSLSTNVIKILASVDGRRRAKRLGVSSNVHILVVVDE